MMKIICMFFFFLSESVSADQVEVKSVKVEETEIFVNYSGKFESIPEALLISSKVVWDKAHGKNEEKIRFSCEGQLTTLEALEFFSQVTPVLIRNSGKKAPERKFQLPVNNETKLNWSLENVKREDALAVFCYLFRGSPSYDAKLRKIVITIPLPQSPSIFKNEPTCQPSALDVPTDF